MIRYPLKMLSIVLAALLSAAPLMAAPNPVSNSVSNSGPNSGPEPHVPAFEDPDALLQRVQEKLNSFKNLTGRFLQLGPDGRLSEGNFILSRPGKLRFEYTSGDPILVVSDGEMLTFVDYEVSQVTRWPIKDTPLWILVAKNIRLTDGLKVGPITRADGYVRVPVIDPEHEEQGFITLVLDPDSLEIKAWEVIDAQGLLTRVTILDPIYNAAVDKQSFDFEDPRPGMNVKHGPRRF